MTARVRVKIEMWVAQPQRRNAGEREAEGNGGRKAYFDSGVWK